MPQVFGIEHILYLAVTVPATIVLWLYFKRRFNDEQHIDHIIRVSGVILLVSIAANRLSVSYLDSAFSKILPSTFCGASSLALALGAIFLKRNHGFFHSVVYVGLLGGLITLVYPEFIGQADSIFYPKTITGLWHHSVIVFLSVLMLLSGHVRPSLRKFHYMPLGLAFYMVYGLFLLTMLGYDDAMLIHRPILADTQLNWFVMGILVLALHGIFLLVYNALKHENKSA